MSHSISVYKFILVCLLIITLFCSLNGEVNNFNAYTFINSLSEVNLSPISFELISNISVDTGLSGLDTFINALLVPIKIILSVFVLICNSFISIVELVRVYVG